MPPLAAIKREGEQMGYRGGWIQEVDGGLWFWLLVGDYGWDSGKEKTRAEARAKIDELLSEGRVSG